MSASLVGSEMCIRDSGRQAKAAGAKIASSAMHLGRAAVRRYTHLGPVSYTHLTLPTICSV
eukprot:8419115-Alexandrium_andersonii.AAC.1